MTATVNEEWTWDVTTREAGAVEAGVRIYTWDTLQTVDVDETTDAQGVIPQQQVRQNQYNDSGAGFVTTGFNPYRIRALKYGLRMFGVDQNFEAPTRNTFFLTLNTSLTETVKATVDAYTGITYNHTSDVVTLDGTGITPVNNVNRLYDHTQTEAVDVPQYDFLEIMSTVDAQNFLSEYGLIIDNFGFDGQSRSINFGTKTVTIQGAAGDLDNITITGNVVITTASANLSNVIINGNLSINIPGASNSLTFNNVTVTGDTTNDNTGTLDISATNSNITSTEEGTGAGQVNIIQSFALTFTGVVNDSEVRLYLGDPDNAVAATELDGVESSMGDVVLTYGATGNGYYVVHKEDYDYILQRLEPLPTADSSIPISQSPSRVYENPP